VRPTIVVISDGSLTFLGVVDLIRNTEDFELGGVLDAVPATGESAGCCRGSVVVVDPFAGGGSGRFDPLPDGLFALVLTDHLADTEFREALAWGARGYLRKSVDCATLVHALTAVAHGGFYLDPLLDSRALTQSRVSADATVRSEAAPRLTPREQDVLSRLAQGMTHKQIGRELGLSKSTVDTYVYRISQKISGGNKAQLTRLAMDLQLVPGATVAQEAG
jgi:two-component system, NarL family, nitrate/nitrite response regulator NarL